MLLPRSEKRTVSSKVDLFLMECISMFKLVSLPSLMIKDIHKVVHVKEGKHEMCYRYFLNKVFNSFKIVCEKCTSGIIKYMFTLKTLIQNVYVEGKVGTMS